MNEKISFLVEVRIGDLGGSELNSSCKHQCLILLSFSIWYWVALAGPQGHIFKPHPSHWY